MPQPTGRKLSLSLPRRTIGDLMHFAKQVPTIPVQRRMRLSALVAARQAADPRPSWVSIFTKAYGLVAARWPELRRSYMSLPTAHLYEHPGNVASVAVERRYEGEDGVFFGHIRSPETRSLEELDDKLRHFKEDEVESIGCFRRMLSMARLPRPLRRLAWWLGLNAWGRKRATFFGTFGISSYSGLGAASLHPLTPCTTCLNYDVIDEHGDVDVRIVYDHRVLDGATIARVLADLEKVLTGPIVNELGYLRSVEWERMAS